MKSLAALRSDFPVLARKIDGKPIVYLDSAATSLRPRAVIEAEREYYDHYSANVFRGIYRLSEEATTAYENSRGIVARFIGAESESEVIFVRNTTEAINLVSYGVKRQLQQDDHIITTILEHHSNFVPWQQLSIDNQLVFDPIGYIGSTDELLEQLNTKLTPATKLVSFTAASNVTGLRIDVARVVSSIRKLAPFSIVVIDAAQHAPHVAIDVKQWGADAIAFSGHKMMGPTGIGVLWVSKKFGDTLAPFLYGGEMIDEVHTLRSSYKQLPYRFEAGTPHIAGAIGLTAAISYLSAIGLDVISAHEHALTSYAIDALQKIDGLHIIGPTDCTNRGGVIAWTMDGIHPHDCAQILDTHNVCVRAGLHCAQPLHEHLGLDSTVRASLYTYNTEHDIDALIKGLQTVKRTFRK